MITKSLVLPSDPQSGDEWHSPDGHSPVWKRVFNTEAGWVEGGFDPSLTDDLATGDTTNDDSGQESGTSASAQGVRADGETSQPAAEIGSEKPEEVTATEADLTNTQSA